MSVPDNGHGVKKAAEGLLKRFNVKDDYLGVESVGDMSGDVLVAMFHTLMKANSQMSLSTKFRIGDIYNKLGDEAPTARRLAMKKIAEEFTENDRQTFRTCGWVARKWPRDKRSDSHGWTYFLRNAPGVEMRPRVKERPMLELIETENHNGYKILVVQDKRGREFGVEVRDALQYGERHPGYGAELLQEVSA